jgi:tRNA pseudouridine55 synthase
VSISLAEPAFLDRRSFVEDPEGMHETLVSPDGGILLIDKPYGETSFYVVNHVRKAISRATGIKRVKVGHAGTLDPLATGLLLLATRRCTKALAGLTGLDKTYSVTVRFGITSPSYDLERPIEVTGGEESLSVEAVTSAIMNLLGDHAQIPPAFSAIKQQGKPVYHMARRGESVTLEARPIEVKSVDVISVDLPFATFRVLCSKGTYIRSLVRDLGESLGTGAVLTALRRETVGPWSVDDALTLAEAVAVSSPILHTIDRER